MRRKGNPSALLVGMQTGVATVENTMKLSQKLKMKLPFDLPVPFLGIYPKNPKTPIQKYVCTSMFRAALFIIAKIWKQPKCPSVDEWIQKLWFIYTLEYYAAEKKEFLPLVTAWLELETIMVSEISQSVKDKYHMISLIRGI